VVVDQKTPINKIDPKTKAMYKEYISYIPKDCRSKALRQNKIVIRFEALDSDFIGYCNKVFKERIILLDVNYWRWTSTEDQKQLLFHELSHCLLNKEHVEDITNYMYPAQYSLPMALVIEQVKMDIETFCSWY
jgi:hypothetical protein